MTMDGRYQDLQASALYAEQAYAASMQGGGPPAGWWADAMGDSLQEALRGRALPRAANNKAPVRRGEMKQRHPQHQQFEQAAWDPEPMLPEQRQMYPAYLYDSQLYDSQMYESAGTAPGLSQHGPSYDMFTTPALGRIIMPHMPNKGAHSLVQSAHSPPANTPTTREPSSPGSLSSMCQDPAMAQPMMSQAQGGAPKWKAKDTEVALAMLKGTDPTERERMLEQVLQQTWSMSLMRHGCHIVQAALDIASAPQKLALMQALRGHVWEAVKSPHANHVLQRCIAVLPPGQVDFVLQELQGCAVKAARHHFGCRILQRLLEHCTAAQTAGLVEEIFIELIDLCRHPYGNYVVQHILEHGLPQQRHRVAEGIWPEVQKLARHKISSHVVQSVFAHCALEEKEDFAKDLEGLMYLQHSHWGSFVAKEMKKRRAHAGER
mmetsp:Transcript_56445/g.159151  ORF Transcript_56445/g.159151 Transcript_56445/m.159151 type:complete len:434 (-) Transcript_56445:231-1532(-)